jgi:hypothetical protein
MTEIVETHAFLTAHDLLEQLRETLKLYNERDFGAMMVINGQDGQSDTMSKFHVRKTRLSDGSYVHDIVLT